MVYDSSLILFLCLNFSEIPNHSFQGVRKASLRRRLGAKAQLEVKASRRLGKWSKATLCRRQRLLEQGSSGGWNRAPTAARGGGGMSRGGSGASRGSGGGASSGSGGGASSGSGGGASRGSGGGASSGSGCGVSRGSGGGASSGSGWLSWGGGWLSWGTPPLSSISICTRV
jgi:hypothetical protein